MPSCRRVALLTGWRHLRKAPRHVGSGTASVTAARRRGVRASRCRLVPARRARFAAFGGRAAVRAPARRLSGSRGGLDGLAAAVRVRLDRQEPAAPALAPRCHRVCRLGISRHGRARGRLVALGPPLGLGGLCPWPMHPRLTEARAARRRDFGRGGFRRWRWRSLSARSLLPSGSRPAGRRPVGRRPVGRRPVGRRPAGTGRVVGTTWLPRCLTRRGTIIRACGGGP